MSRYEFNSFEGVEGLQRLSAIGKRLRRLEQVPGAADSINSYAAELTDRDAEIRRRFGSVFALTGHTHNTFTNRRHTPRIALARIAGQGAKLTVELSTPADRQDAAGQLDYSRVFMDFYDGGEVPFHDEEYRNNWVVTTPDYAAASAAWSRTAGSQYDGYQDDIVKLENAMYTAEDRLATIETALADLSLNPQFATILQAGQQG